MSCYCLNTFVKNKEPIFMPQTGLVLTVLHLLLRTEDNLKSDDSYISLNK